MHGHIGGALRCVMSLAVLSIASGRAATAQDPISIESEAEQTAQDAIERLLETRVSQKFHNRPLSEILAALSDATGVPILLDNQALIGGRGALSCELTSISLRMALDRLLEPLELTWIIKDEVLLVTNAERSSQHLVIKVYPVADLVGRRGVHAMSYPSLIDTITDSISAESWDEYGGAGTIQEFRPAGALVIGQTQAIHTDIARLLIELSQTGKARAFPSRLPPDPPATPVRQPAAANSGGFF